MFVNGEDCALTTADKTAGITFFVISNKLILLIFLFLYFLCFPVGRRGLCGTMFIFKIAGAMAEAGTVSHHISQS